MSRIYPPHITAQILAAMESAEMGNNGYARMPLRGDVATALRAAGFRVEHIEGNSYTVYTARSWACFVAERNAEVRAMVDRQALTERELNNLWGV